MNLPSVDPDCDSNIPQLNNTTQQSKVSAESREEQRRREERRRRREEERRREERRRQEEEWRRQEEDWRRIKRRREEKRRRRRKRYNTIDLDCYTLTRSTRVRLCQSRWRYGRRRRNRRGWGIFGRRRRRDVESWGKTNQRHGYRNSTFTVIHRNGTHQRKHTQKIYSLNSNQTKDFECQKFVEDANKITDLLQEFNRTESHTHTVNDTFASLATSIINATDEKGAFKNGGCNEAQRQALVKVHGIYSFLS